MFSEVGYKESARSETMRPQLWIDYIQRGSRRRRAHGDHRGPRERQERHLPLERRTARPGLIDEIAESGLDLDKVLFEAPNKDLQIQLIRRFGSEVNLGNIATTDIVALETLAPGPARRHPARTGTTLDA